MDAALTPAERVRVEHIPEQVYKGYPEDPETGMVDTRETCIICQESMPCAALEALAEVENARKNFEELWNLALQAEDAWRQRAEKAEGALARVADKSTVERIARVLIGQRYSGRPFRGVDWDSNPLDVRDAKAVHRAIIEIATEEASTIIRKKAP